MDVKIGKFEVGDGHPVFITAEIGINHNGNMALAKRLIDVAKEAGCQAVKFQKRTVPIVYSQEELSRGRETPPDIAVLAMRKGVLGQDAVARLVSSNFENTTNGDLKWALELTKDEYNEIDGYCKEKGILWFASPWDEESVDFLEQFDPPAYKIASASLTDDGLLRYIRAKNRPVILSTGMSTSEEVDHAVEILGKDNLVLLHCVSTYPAELEELNLSAIKTLKDRYQIPVGYSGHEKGVYSTIPAVALGACMVERHITLDRTMWGSDQAASIEPKGLNILVRAIRNYEKSRGDGVKRVMPTEVSVMKKLRRKGIKLEGTQLT